ncbi:hypothetical protein [Flavihumibacter fluvii]|uniref:hypothetical protein n=1 Tax=Flavihumibacter fluvii TaxID=2838157 RepID=UPI001BDE46DD|nr:hypothetical protein [Flavihumibacter fluvii]ULQ53681.1 hypothetical protein KJS93_05010 [Flavihumibacter fluvii]
MKNFHKQFVAALILLTINGGLYAQSGRSADQAKLPSNRPIPDKRIMERKIEMMRAKAPKPPVHGQQDIQIRSIQAYPNDILRPAKKTVIK